MTAKSDPALEGGSLSFIELAEAVLKTAEAPLIYQDIWSRAVTTGLSARVRTTGKTPWASLGAQLYVDAGDNPNSRIIRVGKRPVRFFLKARASEVTTGADEVVKEESTSKKNLPTERELHPVLSYFAGASPSFNRGRAIRTKTIRHEASKKTGYSEWTYPDIVGFSIPLDDWGRDVLALNAVLDRNALTLFSFEMKRVLNQGTYREAFFQAVSNSSWAHQGYLVAASIDADDELRRELERLASSFGIGIIELDLENPGESTVVYPARVRTNLDWETISKLCYQSRDFRGFIESVKIDEAAGKIHVAEYDEVKSDIHAYVKGLAKAPRST